MLRPQRGKIVVAVLLLMAQTACMLAGPILVRYGIDHGIGDGDTSALNLAGALFVVTAIGGFFFARSAILLVARGRESRSSAISVCGCSGISWASGSTSSRRSRPVGSSRA